MSWMDSLYNYDLGYMEILIYIRSMVWVSFYRPFSMYFGENFADSIRKNSCISPPDYKSRK